MHKYFRITLVLVMLPWACLRSHSLPDAELGSGHSLVGTVPTGETGEHSLCPPTGALSEARKLLMRRADTSRLAGVDNLTAIVDVEIVESGVRLKRLANDVLKTKRMCSEEAARADRARDIDPGAEADEPAEDEGALLAERLESALTVYAEATAAHEILTRARTMLTAPTERSGEAAARELLAFYECTREMSAVLDLGATLAAARVKLKAEAEDIGADAKAAYEAIEQIEWQIWELGTEWPDDPANPDATKRRLSSTNTRPPISYNRKRPSPAS